MADLGTAVTSKVYTVATAQNNALATAFHPALNAPPQPGVILLGPVGGARG